MTTTTSTAKHTPGPLEQMESHMASRCEMCGTTKSYLEPAFNPSGQPKTLCRDCRIGSAEILHDVRTELLEALELAERSITDELAAVGSAEDIEDHPVLRKHAKTLEKVRAAIHKAKGEL